MSLLIPLLPKEEKRKQDVVEPPEVATAGLSETRTRNQRRSPQNSHSTDSTPTQARPHRAGSDRRTQEEDVFMFIISDVLLNSNIRDADRSGCDMQRSFWI